MSIFDIRTNQVALEAHQANEDLLKELQAAADIKSNSIKLLFHNDNVAIVQVTLAIPEFEGKKYPFTTFVREKDTWKSSQEFFETDERAFLAALAYRKEGKNHKVDVYISQLLL